MAYEHRENTGSAFPVEDRKSENHPNLEGEFRITCPSCGVDHRGWLKLWTKTGKAGKFFSAAFKFKQGRRDAA